MNCDVYNINTIQKFIFHQPLSNLSLLFWNKYVYHHPPSVKNLIYNSKQFKLALKIYLPSNFSYSAY